MFTITLRGYYKRAEHTTNGGINEAFYVYFVLKIFALQSMINRVGCPLTFREFVTNNFLALASLHMSLSV